MSGGSVGDTVQWGAFWMFAAQLTTATGWIIEERLLKAGQFEPMQQVGIEGLLEVLMFIFIIYPIIFVLPGNDNGHLEDVPATSRMLVASPTLLLFAVFQILALAIYTPLSQSIAKVHGSTLRMYAALLRTILVWVGGLVIWHTTSGQFGEDWDSKASPIQIGGFVLIVIGYVLFSHHSPS